MKKITTFFLSFVLLAVIFSSVSHHHEHDEDRDGKSCTTCILSSNLKNTIHPTIDSTVIAPPLETLVSSFYFSDSTFYEFLISSSLKARAPPTFV